MVITIKDEGLRFGARVGAVIYNKEKTKVLLEKQSEDRYVFPGGRIEIHEDSNTAIVRELKEELNLNISPKLKYIMEMFVSSPRTKYHEIGLYYLLSICEEEIPNNFHSLDADSVFMWVPIKMLDKYNVLGKPIKDKIINNQIKGDNLEHIIYREY